MKPEDVLSALVAHGRQLDFGRPDPLIQEARDGKIGKRQPVNWRLFRPLEIDEKGKKVFDVSRQYPITSAAGRQTRSSSRHSVNEIASDALLGMYKRNWYTLQVAIGIGGDARSHIKSKLTRIARRLKERERIWPDEMRRRECVCGRAAAEDYVPDLCELAIRFLEDPYGYRSQVTRAEQFGLSESHWHARARRPFDQVSVHLWSWYFAGIGHIEHRLKKRAHS